MSNNDEKRYYSKLEECVYYIWDRATGAKTGLSFPQSEGEHCARVLFALNSPPIDQENGIEELAQIFAAFYWWWHNQPGSNTLDGARDWVKENISKFSLLTSLQQQPVVRSELSEILTQIKETCSYLKGETVSTQNASHDCYVNLLDIHAALTELLDHPNTGADAELIEKIRKSQQSFIEMLNMSVFQMKENKEFHDKLQFAFDTMQDCLSALQQREGIVISRDCAERAFAARIDDFIKWQKEEEIAHSEDRLGSSGYYKNMKELAEKDSAELKAAIGESSE